MCRWRTRPAKSWRGILDDPNCSDASKLKAAEIVGRATGMEEANKVVVDVQSDPLMKLMGGLERPHAFDHPGQVVKGELAEPDPEPDHSQEAVDRWAESWQEDAEVVEFQHQP